MVALNSEFNHHEKQNVCVIWQAKAGCTSVNKMFFEEEGLLEEARNYHPWIHSYRGYYSKRPDIKKEKGGALSNKNTKWIQFTVNPYRRALSSYIHCSKDLNCARPSSMTDCFKMDSHNFSFKQFLAYLLENKQCNIHFNSQVFHLYKEKDIEYIKMEKLDDMLPIINKKYNLNYTPKTSQHHAKTHEDTNTFVGNKLWNDVKDNIPSDYSYFYDKEIRDMVEQLYGLDIKVLNYTWEDFAPNRTLSQSKEEEEEEEEDDDNKDED